MGVYLNSKKPISLYEIAASSPYFIDKSDLISELIPVLSSTTQNQHTTGDSNRYLCITRPRRFGKTIMADMISAFFSKGYDTSFIFNHLAVSKYPWYTNYRNHYNTIHISFNEIPESCRSYNDYISRIERRLKRDIVHAFPEVVLDETEAIWDLLNDLYEYGDNEKFIFVLDEWDFIYTQDFASEDDRKAFTRFLSVLLKDQPYVAMVYMTGILPIAKYSSGSELNMFYEYTMASSKRFGDYFGFSDPEVDLLYKKYLLSGTGGNVTREGLRLWYDGYKTMSGENLYNPRSVVGALTNHQLTNYWTSAGPYDEIYTYVKNNIESIQDDISLLMSGQSIPAQVQEYASTSRELRTKDEIFSAMVVYGFLSYYAGKVSIPNKELMDKFDDMIRTRTDFGYIYRLASESEKLLNATKQKNTHVVVEILERVHNTESPLNRYNNEAELSKVITFAYLQARQYYDIRLEDHSGTGYVDYIFYPYDPHDDGIIIELKVDGTANDALRQIHDRKYIQNFEGRIGEHPKCNGRVLAVGIAYNRKDSAKRHECKIEELYL